MSVPKYKNSGFWDMGANGRWQTKIDA